MEPIIIWYFGLFQPKNYIYAAAQLPIVVLIRVWFIKLRANYFARGPYIMGVG